MPQREMREQRNAAYHEAAHKVICERFGGHAHAYIWQNESGNENEKSWLGTCQSEFTWIINGELKAAGLPLRRGAKIKRVYVPRYAREYVGMAGMIAELVLEDLTDEQQYDSEADANWYLEQSLSDLIQQGVASESDLLGMGVSVCEDGTVLGWRSRLVKTGIRMVREEWLKIAAEATRLIAEVGDSASELRYAA